MAKILIQGNKAGVAQYGEIFLKQGLNELDSKQYEELKKDAGFCKLVQKGRYTELSNAEIKQDNKVKDITTNFEAEIKKLKKDHAVEIATLKKDFDTRYNKDLSEKSQEAAMYASDNNKLQKQVDELTIKLNK